MLINNGNSQQHEICIIDGQNITQIQQYQRSNNTNNWNPCLPITFNTNKSITITFNQQNIQNWMDWYPPQTCTEFSVHYKNNYLFEGGFSLKLNNLTIHDYTINNDTNCYPIMSSIDYYNASITINSGSFVNITSSTNDSYAFPLYIFASMSSIYITNSKFIDINITASTSYLFYATHHADSDRAIRRIIVEGSLFKQISVSSILELVPSNNDVKFLYHNL